MFKHQILEVADCSEITNWVLIGTLINLTPLRPHLELDLEMEIAGEMDYVKLEMINYLA